MQAHVDKGPRASLLRKASKRLLSARVVRSERHMQRLLHARIPIVKFRTAQGESNSSDAFYISTTPSRPPSRFCTCGGRSAPS